MQILETSVILGVSLGLVYALTGVGLVVIYRSSGYVSFAQGDIATVALYVGLVLYRSGAPYLVTALVVIVAGAVLGVIGGVLVIPFERFGKISAALATIAAGLIIEGVENVVINPIPISFPSLSNHTAFTLGSVSLSVADMTSDALCVLVFLGLGLWFKVSRVGIAMRAANEDSTAAMHMGVSVVTLKRLSWVISGALAGLCGLFVVPMYSLSPTSVDLILVYGFATVVLGGFESVLGALLAGVVIGVATNLVAAYINPSLVTSALYVILLVVLLIRPHGMFGRRPVSRV